MTTRRSVLTVLTLAALVLPSAALQRKRASPHETVTATVADDKVTVTYGRPFMKGRKIWGELVPFGKVWRMGADEATTLTTEKAIMIGETAVPPGKYSLYMLPAEGGSAKLVINKQVGQWGTVYQEGQDLARVEMKKDAADPAVEQFTIAVTADGDAGTLKASWDTASYSVGFTVKK